MKKRQPKISIVIRTNNEEKWITSCLDSVFRQDFQDFEIIIVDNNSTDRTLEKARAFSIKKIVSIDEFLPGKALNLGVKECEGEYIVCLSAHCIPVNSQWLKNLLANFTSNKIAGVYGRQEHMAFTSDIDKRDLINTFGLDRKVQIKDPFFHNANSMISKSVLDKIPFSNTTTNIEDRIWAKEVLEQGYQVIYEPNASVYHHHGINQGRNIEQAKNVVAILEELHDYRGGKFALDQIETVAIVPVRKPVKYVGSESLLELTLKSINPSKYVTDVFVATDNEEHVEIAKQYGAQVILRPPELSQDYIELNNVYQFVLQQLASTRNVPNLVVLAQEEYPFRHPELIDTMIEHLITYDKDTVMAVTSIYKSLWKETEGQLNRIDQGFIPTKFKEPLHMGLYGLCCVIEAKLIEAGHKIGHKVGMVTIDNPFSSITAGSNDELKMVKKLLPIWNNSRSLTCS